jgi:AcrR family transcriptional regulator
VREIVAVAEGEEAWQERLRLGFRAFADQIAGNPEAARLVLVEAFIAGAVAVERMQRTNRLFEALVARSLALAGDAPRLPPLVVKGIVAGGSRLARARLLSGQQRQLALDGDELLQWALSAGTSRATPHSPTLPSSKSSRRTPRRFDGAAR